MIGSLLYLTASKPDITFAVGVCARYQAEPKMSHLAQVKRILKYVNGTCDYGRISPNIPSVPIDNISFHCVENADRWKFVVKRRLAVERNLSEEFLLCQDLVNLINEAGMIKAVSELGKCYEKLTREFLVNITADCDNPLSPEYLKV
ncbi:envelope-like protein, partial [Trifolium pratense]